MGDWANSVIMTNSKRVLRQTVLVIEHRPADLAGHPPTQASSCSPPHDLKFNLVVGRICNRQGLRRSQTTRGRKVRVKGHVLPDSQHHPG